MRGRSIAGPGGMADRGEKRQRASIFSSSRCRLRACCRELGESWKGARTLDLRAKKKDACKVAPEVKDALRRVHMLGAVITKAKKKKGKK